MSTPTLSRSAERFRRQTRPSNAILAAVMPASSVKSTQKHLREEPASDSDHKRIPQPDKGLELAALVGLGLQKYARDLVALLLWLLAALTFFGLTGASSGALLTAWANMLWR